MNKLSVIIPVYNDRENLAKCLDALEKSHFKDYQLIVVDDGSTDQSWSIISRHALKDKKVRGIRFTRNFGHQHAVLAGLRATQFSYIGIIDADLQDPPEYILTMLQMFEESSLSLRDLSVVQTVRSDRVSDSFFKSIKS